MLDGVYNESNSAPGFKGNDTLRTRGEWFLKSNRLILFSDLEALDGAYVVSEIEYEYVILKRLPIRKQNHQDRTIKHIF